VRIPKHVVDCNDVLFVDVLCVADDGCAGLQPDVAAVTIHQPVVVSQHLALVQHCTANNAQNTAVDNIVLPARKNTQNARNDQRS